MFKIAETNNRVNCEKDKGGRIRKRIAAEDKPIGKQQKTNLAHQISSEFYMIMVTVKYLRHKRFLNEFAMQLIIVANLLMENHNLTIV